MANGTKKSKRKLSYSDLTLDDLKENFGIRTVFASLFQSVASLPPDSWLSESLKKGTKPTLASEKARAEFIVAPILLFIRELCAGRVSLYSGIRFDVEPEKGLKGICDFLFSQSPPLPTVQVPVVVLVEAKKNDIEQGLGQCAAEMVAAQIFNHQAGNSIKTIYGCVTTGEDWQFLQLTDADLTIDEDKYFISEVGKILGILKHTLSN